MKQIASYIFFLAIIITGCNTAQKGLNSKPTLSGTTAMQSASAKEFVIRPKYEVYHLNDTLSELHFKLNSNGLLYTKREGESLTSNCIISYQLCETINSTDVIDSASIQLTDVNNDNSNKYLIGKLYLHANTGIKGYLKITVFDRNRNFKANTVIEFDKMNNASRQNFLVTNSGKHLFKSNIKLKDSLIIKHCISDNKTLYVKYYNRFFAPALPPFSSTDTARFDSSPDSIFTLKQKPTGSFEFTPERIGFYYFQTDTLIQEGLTLFVFSNASFPEIKKTEDMFYALRFITSKEEYEAIETSTNQKIAIENFWLNTVNNDKEKARKSIRKYYNRVQKANENFTSYIEGWKTDRGMIYLIFGRPNSFYKAETSETWIYNEDSAVGSISFTFVKSDTPFSNNHLILQRSTLYRQSWLSAVDLWRSGRAYYLDE
jgi:GWxTD domain-containing protein